MENEKLSMIGSAISVQEQSAQSVEKSDVFMLIKFRLLDTLPNLNSQGVTQAFIDDMISRQDQLIGLPLYCDVQRLLHHDYAHLGHMYDDETGTFYSTQIGSMTAFEKVIEDGISVMIVTAKIPKREFQICDCIRELFSEGALKFSFEISYNPECVVERDGTVFVDGSPDNSLTGAAIVSVPACVNSCALQMVAEKIAETDEGVEKEMENELIEKAVAEAIAAKEEEMAKALAEKDEEIAKRDAQIAELNNAIAENPFAKKDEEPEESAEKEEATAEENKEEAVASDNKDEACAAAADEAQEDMKAELEKLKAELEAANVIKAEYEAMKAEKTAKELAENQAMAKSFAEKQGLDISDEAVSKAIADVDYKMIAELTMKLEEQPKEEKTAIASMVCDGFEMKGGEWDDLLAPAK